MTDYKTMRGHTEHHDVKGWLIRGARDEDANTIREAIERMSSSRIRRRVARMLTEDEER